MPKEEVLPPGKPGHIEIDDLPGGDALAAEPMLDENVDLLGPQAEPLVVEEAPGTIGLHEARERAPEILARRDPPLPDKVPMRTRPAPPAQYTPPPIPAHAQSLGGNTAHDPQPDRPARPLESVLHTEQTQHHRMNNITDRLRNIIQNTVGEKPANMEVPRSETAVPLGNGDVSAIQYCQEDVNFQLDTLEHLTAVLTEAFG